MIKSKRYPRYVDFRGFLCFQILDKLSQEPLYGEVLAQEIGAKKFGKLTPGTIYPALKMLRENKLVKFRRDNQKKVYCLTPKGTKEHRIAKKLFKSIFKNLF